MVDAVIARVGKLIGKPRGWERLVRAIAPPQHYADGPLELVRQDEGYVFPVDRGTIIGWSVHFFGAYEPEVRAEIRRRLRPGDVAIDVGANVGWHTLLMASRVGAAGRVFAVEPNATTRQRLEHAIAVNKLAHVHVEPRAMADREGPRAFAAPAAGHMWDGTGRLANDGEHDTVDCTTLDAFTAERDINRVALIKIDVEGWEPAVLRGASRVLRTSRPTLIFEYDPAYVHRSGASGEELADLLHQAGYGLFILQPRGGALPVATLDSAAGNFLAVARTAS